MKEGIPRQKTAEKASIGDLERVTKELTEKLAAQEAQKREEGRLNVSEEGIREALDEVLPESP